jgi:hypothetical protein
MALRTLEAHDLGLSWTIDESLERTSHALVDEGRVWLVDPVEDPAAMERIGQLGEPQAVLQLLDRHNRDCAPIAERLGIPHVRLPEQLSGTPFEAHRIIRRRYWNEVALWWPARKGLIVAEALGTNKIYAVGPGPVGVHPMLRLVPPSRLRQFDPEHLLAGHGLPLHGQGTTAAVRQALDRSWRDLPKVLLRLPSFMRR